MDNDSTFNRKKFLEIVNSRSSDDLFNLYKIIFKENPRGKTTIIPALRRFNGFGIDEVETISRSLDQSFGQKFLLEIANVLAIQGSVELPINELCNKITKSLCNVQRSTPVSENYEEIMLTEEDEMEYQNKSYENQSNEDEPSRADIYKDIENLDEENMNLLLKINDMEEQIENLEKLERTDENLSQTRSLNRQLRIVNAKAQMIGTMRKRLEDQLTIKKSHMISTSQYRSGNQHQQSMPTTSKHISQESQPNLETAISTMMLRHTVGTDLPDFDGTSPLAWNHFLLKFNLSSTECKISNEENLLRLNKHIKGGAREKVKLLLLSSNSPQQILSILNRQYGGDDKILQEIINEIQKVNIVRSLSLFEDFNCSVQNTSAVLSTIKKDFFDSQKILAIYLNKLPEHIVMQWASHIFTNNLESSNVQFSLFANWIESMSKIVNDVNFTTHIPNIKYDNTVEPEDKNIRTYDRTCKMCTTSEHFAEKCETFLNANTDERWVLARKFRYCFNCL